MKDLGKLKQFLRIEVTYTEKDIFISQRKYVYDLLRETCKIDCKTIKVHIKKIIELRVMTTILCQRLVRMFIYLAHIRLDIVYVMSVVNLCMI